MQLHRLEMLQFLIICPNYNQGDPMICELSSSCMLNYEIDWAWWDIIKLTTQFCYQGRSVFNFVYLVCLMGFVLPLLLLGTIIDSSPLCFSMWAPSHVCHCTSTINIASLSCKTAIFHEYLHWFLLPPRMHWLLLPPF